MNESPINGPACVASAGFVGLAPTFSPDMQMDQSYGPTRPNCQMMFCLSSAAAPVMGGPQRETWVCIRSKLFLAFLQSKPTAHCGIAAESQCSGVLCAASASVV